MKSFQSHLKNMQQDFIQWILLGSDLSLKRMLSYTQDSQVRLNVYRRNYVSQCNRVISSCYPALIQYIGYHQFLAHIKDYLLTSYPQHYTVRHMAGDFYKYLTILPSLKDDLIASELAKLEHLMLKTHMAPAKGSILAGQIMDLSEQGCLNLRYQINVDVNILRSHYPISSLWRALNKNTNYPSLLYRDEMFNIIIYRYQGIIYFEILDFKQWRLLLFLKQSQTINQCCEFMRQQGIMVYETDLWVIDTVSYWLEKGIVCCK